MENEFSLEKEYNLVKKKYELPDFIKLAEDFDIERINDKETKFVIREIRRAINEKISSYIHLFESLINPSLHPMFVFSILRGLNEEDKESIKKLYKKLSKTQIKSMKLDVFYSEKNEAEFVNYIFKEWQEIKKSIHKLTEKFEESFEKDNNFKRTGYFG